MSDDFFGCLDGAFQEATKNCCDWVLTDGLRSRLRLPNAQL